jgi:hypothetical protein
MTKTMTSDDLHAEHAELKRRRAQLSGERATWEAEFQALRADVKDRRSRGLDPATDDIAERDADLHRRHQRYETDTKQLIADMRDLDQRQKLTILVLQRRLDQRRPRRIRRRPGFIDASIAWRATGRAPRLATNQRSRGSRRSRAGPDDEGESEPPRLRLGRQGHDNPIGGRR